MAQLPPQFNFAAMANNPAPAQGPFLNGLFAPLPPVAPFQGFAALLHNPPVRAVPKAAPVPELTLAQQLDQRLVPKMNESSTKFDVGDSLCDLTIITRDGPVKVESSILCRASEVFLKMVISGMKESREKVINLPQWSAKAITLAYQLCNSSIPAATRLQHMPADEHEFTELLVFSHTYLFDSLLNFLRQLIAGQIPQPAGEPELIPARTGQHYFKLDSVYGLGIREFLLKAVLADFQKGKFDHDFKDITIFQDLARFIWPEQPFTKAVMESEEYSKLQVSFDLCFATSKLDSMPIFDLIRGRAVDHLVMIDLLTRIHNHEYRNAVMSHYSAVLAIPGHQYGRECRETFIKKRQAEMTEIKQALQKEENEKTKKQRKGPETQN
jgi:hypothetical protein